MTNKKEVTMTERTYTQEEVDDLTEQAYKWGFNHAKKIYYG